jgi:hypothetical protein
MTLEKHFDGHIYVLSDEVVIGEKDNWLELLIDGEYIMFKIIKVKKCE